MPRYSMSIKSDRCNKARCGIREKNACCLLRVITAQSRGCGTYWIAEVSCRPPTLSGTGHNASIANGVHCEAASGNAERVLSQYPCGTQMIKDVPLIIAT